MLWHNSGMQKQKNKNPENRGKVRNDTPTKADNKGRQPVEVGGRDGPDPTRYGDWEKAGRCIDF